MEGATHFIEQFSLQDERVIQSSLQPINQLNNCLKITSNSKTLTTVAIWFIKFKKASHE